MERRQDQSGPVNPRDRAKANLEFEAALRGITPEEELRRRGAQTEHPFRVASDSLTQSRGLGRRILDEIKDLKVIPVVPSRARPETIDQGAA